jgi:hypothetical protein
MASQSFETSRVVPHNTTFELHIFYSFDLKYLPRLMEGVLAKAKMGDHN